MKMFNLVWQQNYWLYKISWHQIVPSVLKYKQSKFYEDILHSLNVISILMFTCIWKINLWILPLGHGLIPKTAFLLLPTVRTLKRSRFRPHDEKKIFLATYSTLQLQVLLATSDSCVATGRKCFLDRDKVYWQKQYH